MFNKWSIIKVFYQCAYRQEEFTELLKYVLGEVLPVLVFQFNPHRFSLEWDLIIPLPDTECETPSAQVIVQNEKWDQDALGSLKPQPSSFHRLCEGS